MNSKNDNSKSFQTDDWERRILTQLHQEYELILWTHRVSLRPVHLQISDSNSHWGQWNPMTRTILVSKKLVLEHSWFHVLAILRHEMAHQLVDEVYGSAAGSPHGEAFLWACQRLGVPPEFAKASAHLQENPLDWRTEKKDDASEKLLDKVQKLLALATSSNEHEALLAMNKVREIYAKHNLEQTIKLDQSKFSQLLINPKKKRIEPHQSRIITILIEHFFVRALVYRLFDAASGDEHRVIELIGTRENVLMAEYVYYFLIQQVDFWIAETLKGSPSKTSRIAKKSFRLGILEGFSNKLRQTERQTGSSTPPLTQSVSQRSQGNDLTLIGQALEMFKKDSGLEAYLDVIYPRIRTSTSGSQRVDSNAFNAGETIGRSLSLNKAVTTQSNNQGRLLADH